MNDCFGLESFYRIAEWCVVGHWQEMDRSTPEECSHCVLVDWLYRKVHTLIPPTPCLDGLVTWIGNHLDFCTLCVLAQCYCTHSLSGASFDAGWIQIGTRLPFKSSRHVLGGLTVISDHLRESHRSRLVEHGLVHACYAVTLRGDWK